MSPKMPIRSRVDDGARKMWVFVNFICVSEKYEDIDPTMGNVHSYMSIYYSWPLVKRLCTVKIRFLNSPGLFPRYQILTILILQMTEGV